MLTHRLPGIEGTYNHQTQHQQYPLHAYNMPRRKEKQYKNEERAKDNLNSSEAPKTMVPVSAVTNAI